MSEPTTREQVEAASFLARHYGAAVTSDQAVELAFLFAAMRDKERGYVVKYLHRYEDEDGNDVFDSALIEAGDRIANKVHLP
jgi:hypothetical protein